MTPKTKPREARHGTEGEYRRGCRCELCTAASTSAREARASRTRVERETRSVEAELAALQKLEPHAGLVADVDGELFDRYVAARHERDRAELVMRELELELKRAMGSAEKLRAPGPDGRRRLVASWSMTERRRFDEAAFREAHPTMHEKYLKPMRVRRFVVTLFAAKPPRGQDAQRLHSRIAATRGRRRR